MMATNADSDHNQQQLRSGEHELQPNDSEKFLQDKGAATTNKSIEVNSNNCCVNSIGCTYVQEDESVESEFLPVKLGTPITREQMPTDISTDSDAKGQKSPALGRGVGGDLPADNQYFFEDEVFRVDKKGRVKFGLVIETSETYSGDEDDDFDDVLLKGEVRVAWYPDGKEEVQPEGAIALADRTLMPGDVVRRLVPGKDTQRGYCRDISMHADVKVLGTKYVIKNVMTERLRPINNWQRDSAVCLDSWVGSTKDVEEKAVLRSTAGARMEISSHNFFGFTDYNSRNTHGIFNPHVFYPGNTVVGRLPSLDDVKLLTPNIPIHKNKKGKPFKAKYTIESVETDSVWVHWQCKALSEENAIDTSVLEQPNPCVSGEDLLRLKRLNLFESCMVQISDRNYLKFSNLDNFIKKSQWEKEQASKFKVALAQIQKTENQYGGLVNSVGQTNAGSNSSHHMEKTKKKSSLIDADTKSAKPKKSTLKTDKLGSSNSRDKTSNETSVDHSASNFPSRKASKTSGEPEWVTDDDDEDDDEDVYFNDDFCEDRVSTTTCSSPSPHHSPKHSKRHLLKKKSKVPTKRSSLMVPEFQPKDGDELVTEALLVYSTATVVWQDGTVEAGISSTQLYPIHHLDNHEFFPGDFVVCGKEDGDITYRDYGVIQMVDHQGRTARVKWYTTYTSADEPRPKYNGETEVSVYDLKDHPDFQYRPGTMVIRVANFVGADATCTAGQIIDNFIDGRAKVWWVDGHISMCWPQDLFEVGQYDHADWGHESDDSWETESENSELGGSTPIIALEESHIITNIERTRIAIARLEEIFNMSPNLQNAEVMRNLLNVYKGCRYLDRLLNTSFFHEDNFQGLIERVRKGGTQSIAERAQDRKNRLFSYVQATSPNVKHQAIAPLDSVEKTPPKQLTDDKYAGGAHEIATITNTPKEYAPKILFNISPTPFKSPSSGTGGGPSSTITSPLVLPVLRLKSTTSISTVTQAQSTHNLFENAGVKKATSSTTEAQSSVHNSGNADIKTYTGGANISTHQKNILAQNNQLLNSAMLNIERAFEKTCQLKSAIGSSQDDSGNCSRNENCDGSSTSYSDLTNGSVKVNDDQNSMSCSSIEFNEDAAPEMDCVRLCALLKEQLVKCIQQIREKYYKGENINLSEVFSFDGIEETQIEDPMEVDDEESTEGQDPETSTIEYKQQINLTKCDPVAMSTPSEANACISLDSVLSSPIEAISTPIANSEYFQVLPQAPPGHKFQLTIFHPNNTQQYYRAVQREHRMLKTSLPPGVWVKVFEDRMDLLSVMIEGPKKTPYEDGLFFFDIQLGREYPKSPPLCHYISYCSDRLNPNLYEDGKVCVSLLGTWAGRDSEVWGANSTLLQVIVSIQGLILVPEPYFNEAGYEKQKGTQQGSENSRMYNEMVIIKMVQSSTKLLQQPPELFRQEICEHWNQRGLSMYERINGWMELSKATTNNQNEEATAKTVSEEMHQPKQTNTNEVNAEEPKVTFASPDFPLVPASRGFCLTLAGLLETFNSKLVALKAERKLLVGKSDATATERHLE
ncbi:(E3-independent) E2 ubiquitin-conjugating enzyme [Bactrocera oleae]|uniref:(E3-independent) E2 ubiquitin-conjugating enzyme n=1 Tax=Bactrocera oleae TaxID=104688 RepID=UPI00387EA130